MNRLLGLTALALIGLLVHSPKAHSHMSFGDDFECSESYKKDCWVMANSQRILRLYFRGLDSELGPNCEWQTKKIGLQIPMSETLLGVERGAIEYTRPHVSFSGGDGQPTQLLCIYEIRSKRKDLRFEIKKLNSRWWTNDETQRGVCLEEVRRAEAIPGSLGAGRSVTGSLLQGEICASIYAMPGLDKTVRESDGKERLVKFGTRENNSVARELSDGTTAPAIFREPYTP